MLTNCPRCLARAQIVSPLFTSPLSARELRAQGPAHPAAWGQLSAGAAEDAQGQAL